jgi:RNA polymerase sigma factor (TIGR02999 family)
MQKTTGGPRLSAPIASRFPKGIGSAGRLDATLSSLFTSADAGNGSDTGEGSAADALFAALYSELHRLAERQLARGAPGATFGATSLLHEAYLDICRREGAAFPDRGRFMAYAARVMRGLIIDYARQRQALKRGGQFAITSLGAEVADREADAGELIRISDALDELAKVEPALAQIVDLKFFCGFSFLEIGAMRGVTERTVQRQWEKARIYLHRALREVKL